MRSALCTKTRPLSDTFPKLKSPSGEGGRERERRGARGDCRAHRVWMNNHGNSSSSRRSDDINIYIRASVRKQLFTPVEAWTRNPLRISLHISAKVRLFHSSCDTFLLCLLLAGLLSSEHERIEGSSAVIHYNRESCFL